MTRTLKLVLALLIVSLLAPGGGAVVATAQSAYCATEAEADMLQRINAFRQDNGLTPLTLSQPLGAAATLKSRDMAERNYFAHASPDGRGPRGLLDDVGYAPNTPFGEDLAAGNSGADATFGQWLNSPSHHDTMLGEQFTAVGIGLAHNPESRYGWYWTAMFGSEVGGPAAACGSAPPPVETPVVTPVAPPVEPREVTPTETPAAAPVDPPDVTPDAPSDVTPTEPPTAAPIDAIIAKLIAILTRILAG